MEVYQKKIYYRMGKIQNEIVMVIIRNKNDNNDAL